MTKLVGRMIRHERFMDVCFEVTKVFELPHKIKVTGYWHNMGFVTSYPLLIKQTLNIPIEQISQWSICMENFPKCYRNAPWRIMTKRTA